MGPGTALTITKPRTHPFARPSNRNALPRPAAHNTINRMCRRSKPSPPLPPSSVSKGDGEGRERRVAKDEEDLAEKEEELAQKEEVAGAAGAEEEKETLEDV